MAGERVRCFGGAKQPKVPPSVTQPQVEDKAVQEAAADAQRRRQMARGYRSTILTDMVSSGAGTGKATLG